MSRKSLSGQLAKFVAGGAESEKQNMASNSKPLPRELILRKSSQTKLTKQCAQMTRLKGGACSTASSPVARRFFFAYKQTPIQMRKYQAVPDN